MSRHLRLVACLGILIPLPMVAGVPVQEAMPPDAEAPSPSSRTALAANDPVFPIAPQPHRGEIEVSAIDGMPILVPGDLDPMLIRGNLPVATMPIPIMPLPSQWR
ncbi:hypothetical protein [Tautonia marina]|uniref:hypothetical protein n=1 Tax=Tautonia marina TaxID=2653855 RepID=UPI0012613254|nr:hypothetical protein [Tautonia marina]